MFAALITVGAYIKIPVPVCPFTLQFLFTTLAGIILDAKNGTIAVSVYVLLGLAGLPVFTGGGGIGYVFQPTFGYLIGFIAGSFVTGTIVDKGDLSILRLLAGGFAGLMTVYAFGMAYYWAVCRFYIGEPIGIWQLFLYCFILAVPGDICLCILSAILGKRLIPAIKRSYKIA
ncbi:biotin transporter BioY [Ruminococcus albus]|nr:biotin transporter BioY [Ruminococcus albus]